MLLVYAAPPEHLVRTWLEVNLPLTGLADRGIEVPVSHGHPLFREGISSAGFDRNWPAIGVEWVRDQRTDSISGNFREFKPDDAFKRRLNALKDIPDYRRSASAAQIDRLTRAPLLQTWTHSVKSQVIIAGFASGGTARTVNRIIYETVEGLLAPMCHDIQAEFPAVKVFLDEDHETGISSDQFASPVWGFEIPLWIVQTRRTFRAKPTVRFSDQITFDIHLQDSRSIFGATRGVFEFDVVRGESGGTRE